MPTLRQLVESGTSALAKTKIDNPARDARTLALFLLRKDLSFYYSNDDIEIDQDIKAEYEHLIKRRSLREPLQHLVGKQEFFGLEFSVNRDVLIPRPETEILVEAVLSSYRLKEGVHFCDIGTGSGCIAVALLKTLRKARCVATDLSAEALIVATANAERHEVSDQIQFVRSDLFNSIKPTEFDFVVSNPPYVSRDDFKNLEPEVREYDPRNAVTDEDSGLSIITKIVETAPNYLRPEGSLFLEFGFGQSRSVRDLFSRSVWKDFSIANDLAGIPRIAAAKLLS